MAGQESWRNSNLPIRLFFMGFALMFAGVIILVVASFLKGSSDLSVGGIIIVGPIPIIFGAGSYSLVAIVVAAVLTVITLLAFVWMRRQASKA